MNNRPVRPKLEYVFSINAKIEKPRSAGPGPMGERLHIPITGGRVYGPKLSGKILPGGSDWPLIGLDGNSRIEAHYTIETDDGVLIYVINQALRVSSERCSIACVPAKLFHQINIICVARQCLTRQMAIIAG